MKTKHTPGPWRINPAYQTQIEHATLAGFRSGNYRIADARFSSQGIANTPSLEEAKANARLIAAAPELLEACYLAIKENENNDGSIEVHKKLLDAICKAEGGV